jgi:hypothetical protein
VLRETFGPERQEVTSRSNNMNNEELHKLCSSSISLKEDEMDGAWNSHRGNKTANKMLGRIPESTRPLRSPRRR